MVIKEILLLKSGMYSGKNEDGQSIIIMREVGCGFTIMTLNSKDIYECEDYDEEGCHECSYIER